ncbi:chromosomal replication initiator protein DnaA [[Clostridium] innocuum]|uniref:chromosomal replication initiator protein DnaA n=1 Tax=Clostridium innocuum TaxID=1522 RepID=UPI001F596DDE|nr:chromosomal replication initiator protein DnaA [[Clostridium] innocuum]MCI3025506.1 chromosomal replication initiator protein DnaA [[Clostridium] innocuum]MCR0618158.1 chromosomal replication initiator protein DnaA [[Clostridium] innocuum]
MSNFAKVQLEQIWQKTLQLINESAHFDDAVFNAWYKEDSHLFDIEDDFATIVVPYKINKQIMMDSIDLIQQKLSDVLDMKVSCQILLKSEVDMLQPSSVIKRRNEILFEDKVKKEYTFDSFVVGKNNREAHAAALSVCYYPGKFNNPLFIFGNSGLGKTHLLHAIGNYVKANKADEKVLYIYSEDFVTLLIEAMKNKTVEDVKEMICSVDYLLIDDIQRLKQSTSQEIFFNMYNKLISDNKQIVITSDIHPTELNGIENRLISRFSSGLSVSVGSPEFETAKAILQKKMEGRSDEIMIDDEVLDYLATRFASDVRKLEGTLNELFFKAILYNPERIDITFAKEIFKENPIVVKQEDELTPKRIKNAVCEYYGLTRTQIESKSRTKNIANARHIAIYLCRTHLEMPFAKIGFEFGNRDHSTIMSSYEKMMKLLKEKETFQQAVMQIESNLGIK